MNRIFNNISGCFIVGLICLFQIGIAQEKTDLETCLDMSLEELLNVKVITAGKQEQKASEALASVSVITCEDITKYGWRNLAEVIKSQVGYDVFSDRIYNFIVPRGYYLSNDPNSRILLLVDGHSMVEFFGYYNGHLASVDLNFVKKIEIVRGPNSALYGTNAMFTVINIITQKGENMDGFSIIGEGGSYTRHKGSLAYGKKFNNLEVFAQATYQKDGQQELYFDEYDSPDYPSDGIAQGECNAEEIINGSFYLTYKDFSIHGIYNDRKKNVPTGVYGGKFNDDGTFFQDINQFLEIKYNKKITNKVDVNARVYGDLYNFKGRFMYYPDLDWITGPPYESEYNKIENKAIGCETTFAAKWNEKHNTILGAELKKYTHLKFEYYSEEDPEPGINLNESFDGDPDENILSAYLLHTYSPIKKLILEAGIHYDNYKSVGGHLCPKGSVSYRIFEKSWLKLLYGEAFRAPNFWELNEQGTLFWVEGNAKLNPEVVRNLELIFSTYLTKNINWRTSLYRYTLEANIQTQSYEVDGWWVDKWENVKGLTGQGIETEVKANYSGYNGYGNFSYSVVNHVANHNRIEFTPIWLAKLGVSKRVKDIATIGIESQLVGPRLKALGDPDEPVEGYEPQLDPYNLVNLTISDIKIKNILFSFSVYNMLNTKYEHPSFTGDLASWNMNASFPVYDIPADGISFNAKVKVKF